MTDRAYTEVVTHARARDVALPGGAGTLVLVTLDNDHDHTRPTTLGPTGLAELDATLAAAVARTDIAAIAVTGKPYFFCVGADLNGVAALQTADQARGMAERGHAVFARLRDARVATFAFVNGAAMGGGLELALHCHYRTISSAVPAVALPETFLGLVPGWGGATLVPNLLGADRAVKLIIENPLDNNRMLRGRQAYELGLADAIFEPADFLEQSIIWAAQVVGGSVQVARIDPDRSQAWTVAITRGRAVADARRHGAAPAPYAALELMAAARDRTIEESFAAEVESLVTLMMSDEFRAGVYAFDLVQRRAKKPTGVPDRGLARPVTKVGVVGAGLMAGQLALLFARRLLVPVVLTDLDQERVDRGVALVHAEIDKLEDKARIKPDLAGRLRGLVTGSVDQQVFADADFVIEAVFEDLGVKQQVFSDLEKIVSPTAVLATNTSSLSVTAMAANLDHPERVVGFHFFNPVAVLPLLEIVRGDRTDNSTLATAFEVGRGLKKSCVLVKDAPAFIVNRLLTRFLGEVTAAVDAGTPIEVADSALTALGLPIGPFELLGLVGPAVALHVAETLHTAYPDRFTVSPALAKIVDGGHRAIYVHGPDRRRVIDPDVAALLTADGPGWEADQVRSRAVRALADEIRIMLDEGVVADVRDIDLAMLLGAGWPFHLGGITPYLDRSGVAEQVTGARFLSPGVASVGAPTIDPDSTDHPAPQPQPQPTADSTGPLPDEVFEVIGGELASRGMRLDLADVAVAGDPEGDQRRAIAVTFAMPLPVAQIGMFAGRPLPVPPTMFTAVLRAFGTEVPVDVQRVSVVSAADGEATLELTGLVAFSRTGLGYDDREVTLRPTVIVT